MNVCKRSCCWVPMDGICGRKYACPCHVDATPDERGRAVTDWDQAVARAVQESNARSKEISDHAPWR